MNSMDRGKEKAGLAELALRNGVKDGSGRTEYPG